MNIESIGPHFLLAFSALLLPALPRAFRSAAFVLFPAVALILLWILPEGMSATSEFAGQTLIWWKIDRLSRIFAAIFFIIVFIGAVYAYHLRDVGEQSAALLYGASASGVALAGDFVTLFVWWEIMALSSTYLIWARRDKASRGAGIRYILMHIFGGALLLAGILVHLSSGGSAVLEKFVPGSSLAAWLMLAGVLLNAAAPPLHAWLIDSYPRATVTGSVFLSALTTKAAVYVLARLFPGWDALLIIGVIMAVYGVVFAVLSNDIRELLSYHIVSQVGYMVAGVGIGTEMGINGATAHAVCHILYKALMFMGAGTVLEATGKSRLTELGGLFKTMPAAFVLYMVGAFSIAGFPLFNGFISKSMVVSAAAVEHLDSAVLLMSLASVGTFLSTGLKLPYFTWFSREKKPESISVPRTMYLGMGMAAFLCIFLGIVPDALYRFLPYPVDFEPYTSGHVIKTMELLLLTCVGFYLLRGILGGTPTITLDIDWLYRRPGRWVATAVLDGVNVFFDRTNEYLQRVVNGLVQMGRNPAFLRTPILTARLELTTLHDDYDPDKSRAPLGLLLSVVLVSLLVLTFVAFFF